MCNFTCRSVDQIKFGIQEEPSLSFLDTKFCLLHIKNAKIECLQVNCDIPISVSDNVNKGGPDTDQWSSINLGEVASPVKCSIATLLLSIGSEVAEVLS